MTKLEDIAKLAIEEVNAALEQEQIKVEEKIKEENELKEQEMALKDQEIATQIRIAQNANALKDDVISSERLFLLNLKERLTVLFEGLNSDARNVELRLDITIKFLEFLLASIEDRLSNLPK